MKNDGIKIIVKIATNVPALSNSIKCCVLGVEFNQICPFGSYPDPVTSTRWLFKKIFLTVISFFVSVPVLSVQIIFTHHSVSTEASCFTNALFLANLPAAKESAMFTCAGSP